MAPIKFFIVRLVNRLVNVVRNCPMSRDMGQFLSFCIFVVKFRILFPFHDYKFEGRRLKADGRPPLGK